MKNKMLLGALAAAALITAGSADAATVSLGFRLGGVGPVLALPDSLPEADQAAFIGTLDGYERIVLTGSTIPFLPLPMVLGTTNLTIDSLAGAQSLEIFVTAQGLNVPTSQFLSSFTANTQTPFFTLIEESYLDVGNGLFTLAMLLDNASFTGSGAQAENDVAPGTNDLSYSVTAVYRLTPTTGRPFSSEATIAVAVPGPIAGAGIPALMALGGLVWARRRKAAAAA